MLSSRETKGCREDDRFRLNKTIEDIRGVVAKNANLQEHGYFPLMRFGKNTVTAKDEKATRRTSACSREFRWCRGPVSTKRTRSPRRFAQSIRNGRSRRGSTTPKSTKLYEGMNLEAVQLFADHGQGFARTIPGVPAHGDWRPQCDEAADPPAGNPGFDRDVRRTLAQFIVSNARHTSSAYNLFEMRKAAERADTDGGDIGEEAPNHKYIAEPQEEAHKLRGFLFFNFCQRPRSLQALSELCRRFP